MITANSDTVGATRSQDISFAIVLVTYGIRTSLLIHAVEEALKHTAVKHIIVVDNDSERMLDRSDYKTEDAKRISVLRQNTNTGSAGGYHIGLEYARQLDVEYVVLLDDDLIINSSTMRYLTKHIMDNTGQNAIIIPRSDRPEQITSLRTGYAPAIRANSFHDFHLFDWLRLLGRKHETGDSAVTMVPVDHAPYAGMTLSLPLVRQAQLPDKEFYLYCDDYDYLMKLKVAGAEPQLLNIPPLQSIDVSWNQSRGWAPAIFNPKAPVFRIYYSLRNRVVFELRYVVTNRAIYGANMIAFFIIGSLISLVENKFDRSIFRRLRLFATATSDGLHARLGRNIDTVERYSK